MNRPCNFCHWILVKKTARHRTWQCATCKQLAEAPRRTITRQE